MEQQKFEEWCLVELFGHIRLAGKVSEAVIEGMVRLDIYQPEDEKPRMTQLINSKALYRLTPIEESNARALAQQFSPEPVTRWDVMSLLPEPTEM